MMCSKYLWILFIIEYPHHVMWKFIIVHTNSCKSFSERALTDHKRWFFEEYPSLSFIWSVFTTTQVTIHYCATNSNSSSLVLTTSAYFMPSSERMPGEIFQEKMLSNTTRRSDLLICRSIYASLIFTTQVLGCSQQWELLLLLTGNITVLSGFAHHFAALRTMS